MTTTNPLYYVNGAYVGEDGATISIFDRCFLYGDGVFEGIAVWDYNPYRLDNHLERLESGMHYLRIDPGYDRDQWREVVMELIDRNDMSDGYLRIQVSRGDGISAIKWEPSLLRKTEPTVVAIPVPGLTDYYAGTSHGSPNDQGLSATILSRPRVAARSIPSGIKHCNYLNSVLGAMEVSESNAQIGIAVDDEGRVTEGLAYNVFALRNGELITPPLTRDILPGVTRQAVLELWRRAGGHTSESDLDIFTLVRSDEVFICSTLKFAEPVTSLNGWQIGNGKPGPTTARVHELILEDMRNEARQNRTVR